MRAFLRRLLAALTHSGPGYEPAFRPARSDAVEAWLKAARDRQMDGYGRTRGWHLLDEILDTYRLHADTGTPLGEHACDSGHCECAAVADA